MKASWCLTSLKTLKCLNVLAIQRASILVDANPQPRLVTASCSITSTTVPMAKVASTIPVKSRRCRNPFPQMHIAPDIPTRRQASLQPTATGYDTLVHVKLVHQSYLLARFFIFSSDSHHQETKTTLEVSSVCCNYLPSTNVCDSLSIRRFLDRYIRQLKSAQCHRNFTN